jgi:hypothetical protein
MEATEPVGIPVRRLRWAPCYRIIASRYPTIFLFERVADPEDFDALYRLEAMTNPRVLGELGALENMPPEERVHGPGASIVMAPFIYLNPAGGRFTDASFGAFYAARSLGTAIAETRHHRETFLRATREGPLELTMRCYCADIAGRFHDLRGRRGELPAIYDPESYAASQELGRRLRAGGSTGVAYDSVRDPQGQCLAAYKPKAVRKLRQGMHLRYVWDGARVSHVYELRPIE